NPNVLYSSFGHIDIANLDLMMADKAISQEAKGCSKPIVVAMVGGLFVVLAALIGIVPELIKLGVIPLAPQSISASQIQAVILHDTTLRAHPTWAMADQVADAKKGEKYTVTAQVAGVGLWAGTTWYQVSLTNGRTAWIDSQYVELNPKNAQVPTITPS